MHPRPPAVIESLVRLLVPPASREHVMGDLSERYRSPRQYLVDAFDSLPLIIASQVRRTPSSTPFRSSGKKLRWRITQLDATAEKS